MISARWPISWKRLSTRDALRNASLQRHSVHDFPSGDWPVSHGAKLCVGTVKMKSYRNVAVAPLVLMGALIASSCSTEREAAKKRITPEYDKDGKLRLLRYDSKANGNIDTWSYMDGARVVRIEIDTDADGKIDRWEYYGPDQQLEKVGVSRPNDGKEDAWSFAGTDGAVARTEVSTHRDGKIDRVEYHEHGVMVRADEDTNADGKMDKWETYEGARLTSVALDTAHRGRPDRRLTYGPSGATSMEVDLDGDGHLLPAAAAAPTSQGQNPR
jgi:hypothetical protein